jgi:circadian clock protein KaiC
VADGIIWLFQSVARSSVVRKMQVVKLRGQAPLAGLHTFRITSGGLQIFPRLPAPKEVSVEAQRQLAVVPKKVARLSSGVRALDTMLGGGIPAGSSVLVAGPSGSGKTVLSMQFMVEGVKHREPGLLAVFEKRPSDYLKSSPLGEEVARAIQAGALHLLYLRPLDLSLDETMQEVREMVLKHGIKRVVVDSLSSLELALAPGFREDFRETLHRVIGVLTATGITLMLTVELADSYTDLRFSPHGTAFLTDGIILQRYIEMGGQFKRLMGVVKLRGSQHSKDLKLYEITSDGVVMGAGLETYEGLTTGTPKLLKSSHGRKS